MEVLTDGVRTGYHAEKDGLLMWEGSYLSRTSESVFSWPAITEMTEGLIERGEYKIKLGLQNAPIVAEQLALFDMGGDAPVYEAPADTATGILAPARTVPQEVIDLALCTGGNEPNSADRIAVFYMRELMTQDELAVMDGGKCIFMLRGVRPFLSDKYDLTRHPNYRYTADTDPKNVFDMERYMKKQRAVVKPTDTFDVYEIDATT